MVLAFVARFVVFGHLVSSEYRGKKGKAVLTTFPFETHSS
jgi:hypothetical protein